MQKTRAGFIGRALIAFLILWAPVALAQPSTKSGPVSAVETVGVTVSDMHRSVDFFSKALSFVKISDEVHFGSELDLLQGLDGVRLRTVRMRLGKETIRLNQYMSPSGGRPIPKDSRSHDLWFQHIAIIVSDMNVAYRQIQQYGVRHVSTRPQTIPLSNRAAAGIVAFKFQDPDGHNLELLYFPPGKGNPRWQHNPRPPDSCRWSRSNRRTGS